MKPIKVYKDTVDMEDLLRLSKNYLIKATDGKSMVVIQSGKIILAKGDPPKDKREVVIALYEAQKKMSLKNAEYFVCKIDTMISRNVKADLERIIRDYEHIVVETFSKKAKRVTLVYKNRNLVCFEGDYNKLLTENKAIFDIYEVLREELRVSRRDVLERFKLRDPSEEEIQRIIQHAFGDGIGGYYRP
ncbi:hypothetical protein [Candidatus Pyrohabitans sp.]